MNQHDRWFDGITRNLIRHAARKAPPALSERLGEEWLADLTARSGALSQLRFALGCCWATTVIAHEFGAVRSAAAAGVNKTTVVHHAGLGPSFSRRTTVVLLIVGLHALVIGVLATAIVAPKVLKTIPDRIHADLLPQPVPRIPPALPPDPNLTRVRPDISPPEWPEVPPDPSPTIRGSVSEAPQLQPAGPPMSSKPVNRVLGGPGTGFPNTDDFYPQAAIRQREMGVSTVSVCVDNVGRLVGRPTIDQSSGSARLDEAALRLAQAGSGHYRATTEDGRPVNACYPFRVRFQLRD